MTERTLSAEVEPKLLEREVSQDPVHHLIRDHAGAAQLEHALLLGAQELAPDLLEGLGTVLDLATLGVEPLAEPIGPEGVRPPNPLGRVLPDLTRLDELVQASKRHLRCADSRFRLLPRRLSPVVLEADELDQE